MEGFRLSPQQRHLWAHQNTQNTPFRAQASILVDGNVDLDILQAAIQDVVQRHEILHTSFRFLPDGNTPVQVISVNGQLHTEQHDFQALQSVDQKTVLTDLFQKNKKLPFDFEHGQIIHLSQAALSASRHVVFVALPALCMDAIGLHNLVREISLAYRARLSDDTGAGESMQFADIAEWQNELLEGEDGEMGRAFWRKQDFSNLNRLQLPFAQSSGAGSAFSPAVIAHEIPAEVAAKLDALEEKFEATKAHLLQACFATLLWRMSGTSNFVIGAHYDGRKYEELRDALGLFAKVLPQNVDLESAMPFTEVLSQVQKAYGQAGEWQDFFSWEQMNGSLTNGDAPHFFPCCFDFEELPDTFVAGDISFSIQQLYACIDRFKIKLSCVQKDDSLVTEFHYDAGLFLAEDIQRFAAQFHTLLDSALAKPGASIGALEVISPAERKRLLIDFNDTTADYPKDKCFHHLIEEQAKQVPDKIAVEYHGHALTYRELNRRANRLAHRLAALGVAPDVLVGICVERSLDMIIGVLGILKAGGAYVPLDPSYPAERLAFMLNDTQTPVLVTRQPLVEKLPESHAQILCLDSSWDAIAEDCDGNFAATVMPDNLVYVIYTSGSTGKPKGVAITHQDLVISNRARIAYFNQSVEKFLLLSSLSFDSSVVGIFWTLSVGGTLVLVPEDMQKNLVELTNVIENDQSTHLLTLPTFYSLILEYAKPGQLKSLRTAIVAGEACPLKMVDRHKELLKKTALFSEYGATETTVFSSVYNCLEQQLKIAPVGDPIANAQMYILDSNDQPVPIGLAGEVCFGGDALAQGYLNRPDLTAERFIPNPFASAGQSGTRLYRSGDLARHLPNGEVEFLGRIDNQVKIRGFRIELEEIEATLSQHPAVRETVVVAKDASEWQMPSNELEAESEIDSRNSEDIARQLSALAPQEADNLLDEIEKLSEDEVGNLLPAEQRSRFDAEAASVTPGHLQESKSIPPRIRSFPEFDVSLRIKSEKFIDPPRQFQKNWLINQALNEFADDLHHLDQVSKHFVAGREFKYEDHASNISQLEHDDRVVLEDWQIPIMKAMAAVVTEKHGDVLEIGFGRGVSATFIQEFGVKSHTIIEFSDHVIEKFYTPWRQRFKGREIRLVKGKWQDVIDELAFYDGIFFHTYPVTEEEFIENIVNSVTFAEHFFPTAVEHLKETGIFAYLTNEIDSLSRRHQRLLFEYFKSFSLSIVPLSVPQDTIDLWGANSMAVVKAVK